LFFVSLNTLNIQHKIEECGCVMQTLTILLATMHIPHFLVAVLVFLIFLTLCCFSLASGCRPITHKASPRTNKYYTSFPCQFIQSSLHSLYLSERQASYGFIACLISLHGVMISTYMFKDVIISLCNELHWSVNHFRHL